MKSLFNKISKNMSNIFFTSLGASLILSLYMNYSLYQDNKKFEAKIIELKEENKRLNLYDKKVEELGKKYLKNLK